jgi:hypothetical protein
MLILPRQARDKHRENSETDRFLAGLGAGVGHEPDALNWRLEFQDRGDQGKENTLLLRCHFYAKKQYFTKTGSAAGQT